jgi:hypothetical protein
VFDVASPATTRRGRPPTTREAPNGFHESIAESGTANHRLRGCQLAWQAGTELAFAAANGRSASAGDLCLTLRPGHWLIR